MGCQKKILMTLDQITVTGITAQAFMWACTTAKYPKPLIKQTT